ncbi:MAG: dimethylmenaquinone methyltransferase [Bryobacteraceae bacterium]|nr:dimethylmenaquinone methyltransferase [Bryobacteraceae bacterium]MDW8380429.1 dimethylmenaquinone methyltransferase [Bryobacterales bacterium]
MKLLVAYLVASVSFAQVFTFTREQMLQYTEKNPFDRFADGRPKVPDHLLEKMRELTSEDIWSVLPGAGYQNQFEGGWRLLHPDRKLVGRALTVQFMPARPDVESVVEAEAKKRGATRGPNQRVIDLLQPGDVIVVDLFGKVEGGTFVGDNLATAIYALSKTGMVVDGSIRDLEGIVSIPMAAYFRNVHPSAIRGVMLTGVNIPIRIGAATVMPGDVVFGDREGVSFVPPHLVEQVVTRAETTRIHDEWTKEKFLTGKYKSSDLYPSPNDPALKKEYEEYLKKRLGKR